MKYIPLTKITTCSVMILALLGTVQPALAFSDDFDSYEVGTLDGINGWIGTGTVRDNLSASGANAFGVQDAMQRWETTPASGTLSFKIYLTTCDESNDVFGIHGIYVLVGLHIQNCQVYNNTAADYTYVDTITPEAWHTITYDYNTSTGIGQISIDGGTAAPAGVTTGHGTIQYWSIEGHDITTTTYLDDIQTY